VFEKKDHCKNDKKIRAFKQNLSFNLQERAKTNKANNLTLYARVKESGLWYSDQKAGIEL
jgi:hypothetical protein